MMNRIRVTIAASAALLASFGLAGAAEHEVKMLNVGSDDQKMVFEPALLRVEPGDTVTFVPTDRGHNSASMEAMLPPGAAGWKGAISEPVTVTFQVEGTYGYICEPHYGLGMVGLVLVGDYRGNFEEVRAARQRGQAAQRFKQLFAGAAELPAGAGTVPSNADGNAAGGGAAPN